jgi:hypothetical protein
MASVGHTSVTVKEVLIWGEAQSGQSASALASSKWLEDEFWPEEIEKTLHICDKVFRFITNRFIFVDIVS